jgi:hypothetical protein
LRIPGLSPNLRTRCFNKNTFKKKKIIVGYFMILYFEQVLRKPFTMHSLAAMPPTDGQNTRI